jgi:hypothetical protein
MKWSREGTSGAAWCWSRARFGAAPGLYPSRVPAGVQSPFRGAPESKRRRREAGNLAEEKLGPLLHREGRMGTHQVPELEKPSRVQLAIKEWQRQLIEKQR